MAAITFDTFKPYGFDESQVKAMASVIQEEQKFNREELATKGDLRELGACIMGEMRLNRWMLALVVATTVLPALKALLG